MLAYLREKQLSEPRFIYSPLTPSPANYIAKQWYSALACQNDTPIQLLIILILMLFAYGNVYI